MKNRFPVLVLLTFLWGIMSFPVSSNCINKFWEDFNSTEKKLFLNGDDLSKDAVSYLQNHFTFNNLERTEYLIIEIISADSSTIPPYHFIFNDMCLKSDSALSELLSAYILDYFKAHTAYIVNYFTCKDLLNNNLYDAYISLMVMEIGYEYKPEKFTADLNQYLEVTLQSASAEDQKTAEKIITDIKNKLKKF